MNLESLSRQALATSALRAIELLVKDRAAEVKTAFTSDYVAAYKAHGMKSMDVLLDGHKVATVTLSIPSEPGVQVEDETAFIAWAKSNDGASGYVHSLPMEVIPARDVPRQEVIQEAVDMGEWVVTADGTVVDPRTGETIPGVRKGAWPDPKQYSVRFQPGGQDALLAAWRRNELAALDAPMLEEGSEE